MVSSSHQLLVLPYLYIYSPVSVSHWYECIMHAIASVHIYNDLDSINTYIFYKGIIEQECYIDNIKSSVFFWLIYVQFVNLKFSVS